MGTPTARSTPTDEPADGLRAVASGRTALLWSRGPAQPRARPATRLSGGVASSSRDAITAAVQHLPSLSVSVSAQRFDRLSWSCPRCALVGLQDRCSSKSPLDPSHAAASGSTARARRLCATARRPRRGQCMCLLAAGLTHTHTDLSTKIFHPSSDHLLASPSSANFLASTTVSIYRSHR